MASVQVAVRVRPLNQKEVNATTPSIVSMSGKTTTITNLRLPAHGSGADTLGRERVKHFTYDYSYWSANANDHHYASQEKVFLDLGSNVIESAFHGYNNCVFAYGQTGSGKTHTMMGTVGNTGLIPRICEGLFGMMKDPDTTYRVQVSYLEIYNERVRDLLRDKNQPQLNLKVREHPKDGPYVQDLSRHLVVSFSDVEDLIRRGNLHRTTAATNMNEHSSRSHAIFTVFFTQAKLCEDVPSEIHSKVHLVDLAGSERADSSGATGDRLKEGGSINKSLVTLGNVISTLADWSDRAPSLKRSAFIPYRDSVLTWLLKDSLGGNARTVMIATVSPADCYYAESLSTLRYASRAKKIVNKPTVNEDPHVKLIRELREENAQLRSMLGETPFQDVLPSIEDFVETREKLNRNEERVRELTEKWADKWQETANVLEEHKSLALRKEGTGVVLDSELPYILSIDDNILTTGMRLYHIKEGDTHMGREDSGDIQDIILSGKLVEAEHCIIRHVDGLVTLIPLDGALCSVNNVRIHEPTKLQQGSIIRLGRGHLFRYNHPAEAARLREEMKNSDDHQLIQVWQNFQWTWSSLSVADSAVGSVSDCKSKPTEKPKVVDKKPPLSIREKGTRVLQKLNKRFHKIEKTFSKEKKTDKATRSHPPVLELDQKFNDDGLFGSDNLSCASGSSCSHEAELDELKRTRSELEDLKQQHVISEAQRLARLAEDEANAGREQQLALEVALADQKTSTLREAEEHIKVISEDLQLKVESHAERQQQLQEEQLRLGKLKDKLERDKAKARSERQKLRRKRELERERASLEKERQEIEWAELERLKVRLEEESQLQEQRLQMQDVHQHKVRDIERRLFEAEGSKLRHLVDAEVQEMRVMAGLGPPEGETRASPPQTLDLSDLERLTLRQEPIGGEAVPLKDREMEVEGEVTHSETSAQADLTQMVEELYSRVLEALQRKYSSVLSSDDHTQGLATSVLHEFNVIRPKFYQVEKSGDVDSAELRRLDRHLAMVDRLVQLHEVLQAISESIKDQLYLRSIEHLEAANNMLGRLHCREEIEHSVRKVFQTEVCILREKLLYDLSETWNKLVRWLPSIPSQTPTSVTLEVSQGEGDHDLLICVVQAMSSVGMLDSRVKMLCDRLLKSVISAVTSERGTLLCVLDEVDSYNLQLTHPGVSSPVPPVEAFQKLENVFVFLHRPLHDIIIKDKVPVTLIEKIGEHLCKRLFEAIYNNCLSAAVPKTGVQQWAEYNSMVLLAEKFEDFLQDLDYFSAGQESLMDHLNNVNTMFASIKSQDLLRRANEFMTQELMNSVLINVEHPLGNVRGQENEEREKYVKDCKQRTSTLGYKLPTCQISMPIRGLMCMAYDTLKEAETGSLEGTAHIQASFQSLFDLYCDVVPSYHKEKLTNLPLLAALHHNNCMFVAHHLITIDRIFQLKSNPLRSFAPPSRCSTPNPSGAPRSPSFLRRSLTPGRFQHHSARSLTPGPFICSTPKLSQRSKTPGPYLGLAPPPSPVSPLPRLPRCNSREKSSPRSSQGLEGFAELVPRVKKLGNEGFSRHIGMKTGQLCDHISAAEGFSCVADDDGKQAKLAVQNMMHHLRHISTIWRDVLPMVIYYRGIGSLLHSAVTDIIKCVLTIEEFSVDDCESLQEVLFIIVESAVDLFRLDDGGKGNPEVVIHEYVPCWMRFKELGRLLSYSLKQMSDRWADGKGPLAVHFTGHEVAQLVVAIFENTSKRDALLTQLRSRPSIHVSS